MRDGVQRENHISACYNVYICMFRNNFNAVGTASLPVSMTALVDDSSDVG
jgi:hypothetical protein